MPADGISPPRKGDFGTSRRAAWRSGYINNSTGRKGHDRLWRLADVGRFGRPRPVARHCGHPRRRGWIRAGQGRL